MWFVYTSNLINEGEGEEETFFFWLSKEYYHMLYWFIAGFGMWIWNELTIHIDILPFSKICPNTEQHSTEIPFVALWKKNWVTGSREPLFRLYLDFKIRIKGLKLKKSVFPPKLLAVMKNLNFYFCFPIFLHFSPFFNSNFSFTLDELFLYLKLLFTSKRLSKKNNPDSQFYLFSSRIPKMMKVITMIKNKHRSGSFSGEIKWCINVHIRKA